MKITRIDHVGVCVGNMDAAIPLWLRLLTGLSQGSREVVASHQTEAAFLDTATTPGGGAAVELISPAGGNEGLEKFLERNKGKAGLHHLAFAVDDLAAALRELDAIGVPLLDKTPRPGARGHMVGFLHPKATDGILVELVQDHAHASAHSK
jgi:methylmalonyl-CoA/ethylmalonyl-CoA epimerase